MDKKDIKQKILEALRSNADIKTLDKKFDKVLKALSEKLTTQIITRVAPDIEVVNLEKEISRVVEELKNSNETFKQIIKTNQEVSELPRMVEVKNFKEFKQDNSSIVTALSSFFSGMVEFFTKLASTNTYKVMPDEKYFTTPQMVIVVDPRTMKPVSPKDFGGGPANVHVSTGSASGGGSGGGTASEVKLKNSAGTIIDPATETTLALISGDLGDTADAEATTDGSLIAISKRIRTLLGTMNGYLDGVEGSLTTLVSQTDGIESGIGATSDAESTSGNGSLIALLKNLRTGLGQTTDAATSGNGSLIAIEKQIRAHLSNINTNIGEANAEASAGNGSIIGVLKYIRTLLSNVLTVTVDSGIVGLTSDINVTGTNTACNVGVSSEAPQELAGARTLLHGIQISNPNSQDGYLQLFNGEATLGSTAPKLSFMIPLQSTVVIPFVTPVAFPTSLKASATASSDGNDSVDLPYIVNIQYTTGTGA